VIVDARPDVHPHIAALGEQLMTGGPNRLTWGLYMLINAFLATPRPAPVTPPDS